MAVSRKSPKEGFFLLGPPIPGACMIFINNSLDFGLEALQLESYENSTSVKFYVQYIEERLPSMPKACINIQVAYSGVALWLEMSSWTGAMLARHTVIFDDRWN